MNNNPIRIIFAGDLLLHSRYNRIANEKGTSFVFEKVSALLNNADLLVGNLETVLSDKGTPKTEKGCLRGNEKYVLELKNIGLDILSLANNHSFDFGSEAFNDMLTRLQTVGIRTVGAGNNLAESRKMLAFSINNLTLGFLAYSSRLTNGYNYATTMSSGVAPIEEKYVLEDIEKYRREVDYLIVSLHWGVEYSPYPTPDQISLAHKIIDTGAKIIFGHHPRIIQGTEEYKNGLILYSLGNFCHSDLYWEGPKRVYQSKLKIADREMMIVKVELTKNGINNIDIIPLWLNDYGQPEICDDEKSDIILEKLVERSEKIQHADFEKYWERLLIKKRIGNPIKIWWTSGNLLDKIKNFNFSQIRTLWELTLMFVQAKFSKDSSKWFLFNPGDDKKARPFSGEDE